LRTGNKVVKSECANLRAKEVFYIFYYFLGSVWYTFISRRNKHRDMSSEGFSALEKNVSESCYPAHPVGCKSLLQIVMAVWRIFYFYLNFLGLLQQRVFGTFQILKKSEPNDHYYRQWSSTPN
jgi:hypothetical protein